MCKCQPICCRRNYDRFFQWGGCSRRRAGASCGCCCCCCDCGCGCGCNHSRRNLPIRDNHHCSCGSTLPASDICPFNQKCNTNYNFGRNFNCSDIASEEENGCCCNGCW